MTICVSPGQAAVVRNALQFYLGRKDARFHSTAVSAIKIVEEAIREYDDGAVRAEAERRST